MKSTPKSCDLDPIPTGLMKEILDIINIIITPVITISYLSIESVIFSHTFKEVNVTPLL